MKPLTEKEAKIASAFEELLRGVATPLKVWMPILDSPPSELSNYAKDIAFVILIQCLKETLEQHTGRFAKLRKSAEQSGRVSIVGSFEAFANISKLPARVFTELSLNDQILLSLCRDHFVHGYLGGKVDNETRGISIVESGVVKKIQVTRDMRLTVIGSTDKVTSDNLRPLRERIMPHLSDYAREAQQFDAILDRFGSMSNFFEEGVLLIDD
jgi:glutamine synthetase adenylyltransferase